MSPDDEDLDVQDVAKEIVKMRRDMRWLVFLSAGHVGVGLWQNPPPAPGAAHAFALDVLAWVLQLV